MAKVWFLLRHTWVIGTIGKGSNGFCIPRKPYLHACRIPQGIFLFSAYKCSPYTFDNIVAVMWQILRITKTLIFLTYVDIISVAGQKFSAWYFRWLHCLVEPLSTGSLCPTSCITWLLSYMVCFHFDREFKAYIDYTKGGTYHELFTII